MKRKRLFEDMGDPKRNVYLNWHGTPEEEFTYFAEAFRKLAQETVAALRQNKSFGSIPIEDFRAYPIVFLYRHALELYIKAVIIIGSPMLAIKEMPVVNRQSLLKTHSLEKLSNELERVFDAYEWDWDLGTPNFQSLEDFRKIIRELHEVDEKSDAFRYPLDTKGCASLPFRFCFDLFGFCEILDSLFSVLEGAAYLAYDELQAIYELRADAREWELDNT